MGKAPFVAMQTDLRKEDRVEVIADLTGFNRDEVLGKLFRLWAWCSDRGLDDAPDDCDGYAVAERVIRQFFGARGVDAMLGDGCDELAMGVRRPDGLIYLRGTHETVSRLRALRSTAVAGGRSAAGASGRSPDGRFVRNQQIIQPTDQPETSRPPTGDQPTSSCEPAAASEIPQSTEEELPPAGARAIPPSTEHGTEHDAQAQRRSPPNPRAPEAPPTPVDRATVRDRLRRALEQARERAARTRGVAVKPLLAFEPGIDRDLQGQLALQPSLKALTVLEEQALHAIAMAELEVAQGGKSFEWFTGAIFTGGNFSRLVGMTAGDAKLGGSSRGRAGPGRSAERARDRPPERRNALKPM